MSLAEKPFENHEEIEHEVKLCSSVGTAFQLLSFLFAVLGIIGDASNTTLGLENLSWFLLALIFGVSSIIPAMHAISAKHLLGTQAESEK